MSDWQIYQGDSQPRVPAPDWPPAPPWRQFPAPPAQSAVFRPPEGVVEAVNAAIHLRRPLLVTGPAGSGKSTLIDSVALELSLGEVLRWHVTSSSTLQDALYRYDAIGRLQARENQVDKSAPVPIAKYLRLGPLGTALVPTDRPRALLIDEIDKSDIDLPNDLLNVFERGYFEIPELARHSEKVVEIRGEDKSVHEIVEGKVQCTEFPFVVLTSNGERDFPPAFLRRCIRIEMRQPDEDLLVAILQAHLDDGLATKFDTEIRQQIKAFIRREGYASGLLATDQLMNVVHLVTGVLPKDTEERKTVVEILLEELRSKPT